jgi:hypothetical protein
MEELRNKAESWLKRNGINGTVTSVNQNGFSYMTCFGEEWFITWEYAKVTSR